MQVRPNDPTSALAALIAGNHRHVELRGSGIAHGATDSAAPAHRFPQMPFALVLIERGMSVATPAIFSRGHDELLIVDGVEHVLTHAEGRSLHLVVVIQPIQSQLAQVASAWTYAELRAYSNIESILRESVPLRRAAKAGEIRIVAALLELPSERIHWVGEHPELELLLLGS